MHNGGSSPALTNTGFCGNTPDQLAGDPINDGGGNSLVHCAPPSRSPADTNGDGVVDVVDLLTVLAVWGSSL